MPEPLVYIITGEKGAGKTSLLESVISCMRRQGFRIGGFFSKGYWKGNERSHFELWDIAQNEGILLCKREYEDGWPQWGPFYFNPEAMLLAQQIIDQCIAKRPELTVMDEIGGFEISNQGFHPLIEKSLQNDVYPQLWVVRKTFVTAVFTKYALKKISIFELVNTSAPQICREIADHLSQHP
ncbi:MAG: nucleoside-triphosphatase [Bacteroidales bacterium]